LVMEPQLLLLDEPLSNLDAKLRHHLRFELKRLQRELRITTVYVTHDQSEALALSHEIAVMNEGRIQQIATPREIYTRPVNAFVADFVGSTNFLDGTVLGPDGSEGRYRVRTELGDVTVLATEPFRADDKVLLSVRPEDVECSAGKPQRSDNVWQGVVDQKVFLGEVVDLQVKLGQRTLLSRQHPSLRSKVGESIFVQLDPDKCIALKAA
jgi:iron(III) transport system ATP-binding protein